jgi:radical SAM protein with 4Fe4S-binding SPASM domain
MVFASIGDGWTLPGLLEQVHELRAALDGPVLVSVEDPESAWARDLKAASDREGFIVVSVASLAQSVVTARSRGIERLTRVYSAGISVPAEALKRLGNAHAEQGNIVTVFRPTIPHAVRSLFPVADVVDVRRCTSGWVRRRALRYRFTQAFSKALHSTTLKPVLRAIAVRFRLRELALLTIRKTVRSDAYLDVFKGRGLPKRFGMESFVLMAKDKQIADYAGDPADLERFLVEFVEKFIPLAETIYVISSKTCNLKCVMCPIWAPQYEHTSDYYDNKAVMPPGVFDKVAGAAASAGSAIKIGMVEEPLLNPHIVDFVRRAKELGVPLVQITTNATLLKRERAEALIRAGLDVLTVSLDAATAETYKRIRGADFEKVTANINGLLEMKKALGSRTPEVHLVMIDQEPARHEIDAFISTWRHKVSSVTVNKLTVVKDGIDVLKDRGMYESVVERVPCYSPWREMVVLPEGEVITCCESGLQLSRSGAFSMGALSEASLAEIWAGRSYSQFRRNLLRGKFDEHNPHCASCEYWINTEAVATQRSKNGLVVIETPWETHYKEA